MRVTNSAMIRSYMYDTQANLTRMNKVSEQLNTGKSINRVSDDPHKAIRIMNMNNEIKYTEKYNYNIDETVGWMENTDASIDNVGQLLSDIKESILKVGNGTYSQDEFKAIEAELNEKIKALSDALNTTHGGNYMFGGTNTDEPPMSVVENPDGSVSLQINPNSNSGDLRSDISDGISIDYNVSAEEMFNGVDEDGNTINYLDEINKVSELMNKIANGTAEESEEAIKELNENTKGKIDELFNHTVDQRTSLGVRTSTAEKVKDLNDENILNMKGVLSQDQDVDYVDKYIELKSAEMIYQASIQVGTKLFQSTILDYLR